MTVEEKTDSTGPDGLLNGRYQVVTDLNHGSYGVVSLVKDTLNNDDLLAIKCLNKVVPPGTASDSWSVSDEVKHEVSIHKQLGYHKNISQLLDHFETKDKCFLVMEYYSGGDLYEAIKAQRGPREQGTILEFMNQLLDAVEYCHSRGIYHRDIKPENILIAADGTLKLADWGLATTDKINKEFGVGSERYMAPELFDKANTEQYNAAQADVWSIGVCLLNILFGRNPFTIASQKDKLFMDFATSREALFDIFSTLSSDVFSVLRHSLTIDPDNRSLANMRTDLAKVEIWNTDDYVYDDAEDDQEEEEPRAPFVGDFTPDDLPEVYITTTNRQPFRTPSALGSVRQDVLNSWKRTMQFTPPVHGTYLKNRRSGALSNTTPHGQSNLSTTNFDDIEESFEDEEDGSSDDFLDYAADDHDEMFAMDQDSSSHQASGSSTTSASSLSPLGRKFSTMAINERAASDSSVSSVPSLVQSSYKEQRPHHLMESSKPSQVKFVRTTIGAALNKSTGTHPSGVSSLRSSAAVPVVSTSKAAIGFSAQSAPANNKNLWKFNKNWEDFELDDGDDDLDNDEFYQLLAASLPSSGRSTNGNTPAMTEQDSLASSSKGDQVPSKSTPLRVEVASSSPISSKIEQSWLIPTQWNN